MNVNVLGPLEVIVSGCRCRLGGRKAEKVFAALVLAADRTVPTERLVDVVWDVDAPRTAVHQVQNTISALRAAFVSVDAPVLIATDGPGYRLAGDRMRVDLLVFDEMLAMARAAAEQGDYVAAARYARSGLGLWRGPALAGLTGQVLVAAGAGLNERRFAALEQCLAWELRLGRHAQVIAELTTLVAEYPLRERFTAHLMRALHGVGRVGDALSAARRLRTVLDEELGVAPSREVRDLEAAIRRDAPAGVEMAIRELLDRSDRAFSEVDLSLRPEGAPESTWLTALLSQEADDLAGYQDVLRDYGLRSG